MLSGAPVAQRDRVGDDDLLERRGGQVLERVAGEHRVRGGGEHARGALVHHGLGGGAQRAGRVDHVVDDHGGPALDVADHVGDLGDLLGGALLVEDRQLGADLLGELLRQLHAADVRRDDHEVLEVQVAEVLGEHEHRGHVVHRLLEEALDLAGVEVHREHAVGPRGLERAGDEARGDRLAAHRLLVLARVAVPRGDGDHAVGGGADRRVDHQQQLHQRVVGGDARARVAARRLDDEDVRAAHRLVVAAVDLAVGEGLERDGAEVDAELARDPVRQLGVRAAGDDHEPLVVLELQRGARGGAGIQRAHLVAECTTWGSTASARSPLPPGNAVRVALDVRLARACDPERAGRARRR